jgi:glycosyltransferase involved in cell wall biosynthesis
MKPAIKDLEKLNIVAVIPCHRVEAEIGMVIAGLPRYLKHIIFVDDASPDRAAEIIQKAAQKNRRFLLIRHEKKQGVGGAMISGFRKALELKADIVVKIDGDGQMDTAYLPELLAPILYKQADYAKGNRFRDFRALQKMPAIRRFGNIALGFLAKTATGYWNLFDPTNGFIAIHGGVLAQLPLDQIDKTYFFETSMLAKLYLLGAVVRDVPMPARYGTEVSNLSIHRSLVEFSVKLLKTLLHRLILKNLIYDFSMASIYLIAGFPLLLFGLTFGISKWVQYSRIKVPAPTGTVMLPTLSVIVGIQFVIAAIEIDLRSVPKQPLSQQLQL